MDKNGLSKMEVWCLARCVVGYKPEPSHLRHLHNDVKALLEHLGEINFKSRELLLSQSLQESEYSKVVKCDPESPCPLEADRDFIILDITDLEKLPPLKWIIPGEIPENGFTMLFGEANVGKSFVALDYAMQVAQTNTVVYVLGEGSSGIRQRVYGWCIHHQKSTKDFKLKFALGLIDLFDPKGALEFMEALEKVKPYMIVIDTLSLITGMGDENSARDMNILLRNCLMIQQVYSTTILFIHHTGKDGMKERGSGALRARVDTMIQVVPADELIAVESLKSRDEKRFDTRYLKLLPVDVPGHGQSLVPVPAAQIIRHPDDPASPDQRRILEVMALEVYEDGIPLRELAEASRLSIRQVQTGLSNLLKKGMVYKPKQSYAINDKGRNAIGLESLNRSESQTESGISPHESVNRLNRTNGNGDVNRHSDSPDSSDSAIHTGEPPDSSDSQLKMFNIDQLSPPVGKARYHEAGL